MDYWLEEWISRKLHFDAVLVDIYQNWTRNSFYNNQSINCMTIFIYKISWNGGGFTKLTSRKQLMFHIKKVILLESLSIKNQLKIEFYQCIFYMS